jgi:hypothetical protein
VIDAAIVSSCQRLTAVRLTCHRRFLYKSSLPAQSNAHGRQVAGVRFSRAAQRDKEHNTMVMRRIVVVVVVVSALAWIQTSRVVFGQAAPAQTSGAAATPKAQAPAAPIGSMPLVNGTLVQIKPDMVLEWQEFQQKETIPMLQKAGVKQRRVFQTVIGPAFEFATLTPATNMAERDGEAPVVKALGADGARAYGQRLRRFIASQRTFALRLRTDLSWVPDPNAKLPVAVVSNYSIAAGRVADFESFIKTEVMPAHKKLKTGGYSVYQTQFGGEPTFYVATLLSNFAEIDKGAAATRAFGPAGAARGQQKLAGVVTHVERTVVREVPELSFASRQTTENR